MIERICGRDLGVGVTFLHIVQEDADKRGGLRFIPFSTSENLPLVLFYRSDVERSVEMRDFELIITRRFIILNATPATCNAEVAHARRVRCWLPRSTSDTEGTCATTRILQHARGTR